MMCEHEGGGGGGRDEQGEGRAYWAERAIGEEGRGREGRGEMEKKRSAGEENRRITRVSAHLSNLSDTSRNLGQFRPKF